MAATNRKGRSGRHMSMVFGCVTLLLPQVAAAAAAAVTAVAVVMYTVGSLPEPVLDQPTDLATRNGNSLVEGFAFLGKKPLMLTLCCSH